MHLHYLLSCCPLKFRLGISSIQGSELMEMLKFKEQVSLRVLLKTCLGLVDNAMIEQRSL